MNTLTAEDIAWLAGLFEGEGWLTIQHPTEKKFQIPTGITMTDEDVIKHVHDLVGVGKLYGPYKPKGSIGKKMRWGWRINKVKDAVEFLSLIEPHLFNRRSTKIKAALAAHKKFVPWCRNGKHKMTEENTFIGSTGTRWCVICKTAARVLANKRKREKYHADEIHRGNK